MGTFGGRRAVARAAALVAASVPLALLASCLAVFLTSCSGALDLAHSVQTRLNRIDEVAEAKVSTPSASTAAAITVTYTDAGSVRELTRLIAAIDGVADEERYPSYRLDLVPSGSPSDVLTVDDTFAGSPDEPEVLGNWFATTTALLGDVHYRYEPGQESIDLESGAGILHDVGEASRIDYGYPGTVWTFHTGDSAFVVSGRVSPSDVSLFQTTQRSVTSGVLPAPAGVWDLQRRDGHVLLDLDVAFAEGPVPPEGLTIERYGDDVQRLAVAAIGAARIAGLPITLRLVNPVPERADVFGFWSSDRRPVRGRDPLGRGWDAWLVGVAKG